MLHRHHEVEPLAGRRGGEDAARTVDHRRHAHGAECVAHGDGVVVAVDENGHVARPDGTGGKHGGRRQQTDDVAGEVGGDAGPGRDEAEPALGRQPHQPVLAVEHPDAQRLVDRRPGHPPTLVRRCGTDLAVDDAGVAEAGTVEQHVVGVEQALIAAPVDLERALSAGHPRRLQVGVDVGTPEGVDGLLGVADQHKGRIRARPEGPAHDVPLDGIGVLELVHQRHPVAGPEAPACGLAPYRIGEGVPEPGEQVVVGEDCRQPPPAVDLLADCAGQAPAQVGRAVALGVVGLEDSVGVRHCDLADLHRLGQGERRRTVVVELADVQVGDHLVDQVAGVLDEGHVALDVAGHAEAVEHVLAEAVGGGDGGSVKVGEGGGEAVAPAADIGRCAGGEKAEDVVIGVGSDAGEGAGQAVLGGDHPLAHPVAQLAGGHAGEGDDQQVLERETVGHVAGGEGGDGEGLPGAGAGLEHGDAGRQRPADVERGDRAGHRHRSSIVSVASSPSHIRRAARPKRDASMVAASAMRSSNERTPPRTSWWATSTSSPVKYLVLSQALRAAASALRPWATARA